MLEFVNSGVLYETNIDYEALLNELYLLSAFTEYIKDFHHQY